MEEEQPVQFPNYQPPTGTPIAERKQQGPLIKMMTKMLPKRIKPRLMGKSKGIEADMKVHIKHKKVRFYSLIFFLFILGCKTNPFVTPVVAPGTTNVIAYVPAAGITNALQLGKEVAPAVPAPFGTILDAVLGIATVGLGYYAKIKTSQLSDHQAMLNSVILGVEKAGTPQTKQIIEQTAVAAGVQDKLAPIVREITSQLPKT